MKPIEHYRFAYAARPFSLVVGLVGAGLGGWIALQEGQGNVWLWGLMIMGAVLAQVGINLVNDLEDLDLFADQLSQHAKSMIRSNARWGFASFAAALAIGGFFVLREGVPLLILVGFNAALALNYNLGPINFKKRGLALVQVFVQMGVLLVLGGYLALGGEPGWQVVWLSLPISLLVSLLLLSNELRDFERDSLTGLTTVTVRIGYSAAVILFWCLIGLAFLSAVLLYSAGMLDRVIWLALPLLLLPGFMPQLRARDRQRLAPLTGRFFLVFGLAYMACV